MVVPPLSMLTPIVAALVPAFAVAQSPPTRPPAAGTLNVTLHPDEYGDNRGEVIVPLSLGKVIGRRIWVRNVPWTSYRRQEDSMTYEELLTHRWEPLPRNNSIEVYVFLGIPYTEKPVAERRMKPPQLMTKFHTDPIRALNYRAACIQDIDSRPSLEWHVPYEWATDEDCLYLNIFSPQISSDSVDRSAPVIVFLHGGAFQYGSANDWPGHVLASKGVVVVTLNYRLGALGFLSTGAKATGNMGVLDQRAALQFVRDHIYAFGGDASRVTLIGHGAGAVSAGLHMLSPLSRNLFHAVGAMSGAETSYWQTIIRPDLVYNNTRKLGRQLGCSQSTIDEVYACIQSRSGQDILKGTKSMVVEYNNWAFLPFVDRYFLPNPPMLMLKASEVASPVPYMTGVNLNDGTVVLLSQRDLAMFTNFEIDQPFVEEKILEYTLRRNYTSNRQAAYEAIRNEYTYWPDQRSDYHVRRMFLKFASDAYYVAPVSQSAHLHSMAGSFTYMYVNAYNFSTGSLQTNWAKVRPWLPYWMGVCHECDLYLLFGFPWMKPQFLPPHLKEAHWTSADRNASELFMTLWQRFATNKNPNIRNDDVVWPNLNKREYFYLLFNYTTKGDGRLVQRNYEWQSVAFWNEYLPSLANIFTTTFWPELAIDRHEIFAYKVTSGVFISLFCLALLLVLLFAYLLYERPRQKKQATRAASNGVDRIVDTSRPIVIPPNNHFTPASAPIAYENSEYDLDPKEVRVPVPLRENRPRSGRRRHASPKRANSKRRRERLDQLSVV